MKHVLTLSALVAVATLASKAAFAGAVGAVSTPEPASLALIAGGVAAMAIVRGRRK